MKLPWSIDHLWLVPLLPFLGFLVVGLGRNLWSRRFSAGLAIGAIGLSTIVGWSAALEYYRQFAGQTLAAGTYEWLRFSPTLVANVGILVDDISMLLVLVVTTISLLVHVYSLGYMRGDAGYARFFAFLNLFTASMLGLVLSYSLMQMYVFWELVGLSSFLLIGHYWDRPAAVAACKKAFIVTRFADLGFLLGLLLLSYHAGGFDFRQLTQADTLASLARLHLPLLGVGVLPLSAILIFTGAAGKSAMFPLHIWLPDAMEGPTPVSALIHAATMVVAGVYLVARLFPLFAATPAGLATVMAVGTFTALFAAVIAVTQFDIKRVLAFSTLSQLGYMMLALGVATSERPLGFTAAMFHLTTHAFFKALLFLAAGSVIHGVHTNDARQMGGLRRQMPVTHATFLVACLAIAGVPPLSGFFSKDEILTAAWVSGHALVFGIGLAVAGLTALYMFRLYFLVFWNQGAPQPSRARAHEPPLSMLAPLVVLAMGSVGVGWIPFAGLMHRGVLVHEGIHWSIAGPAILIGGLGIGIAAWLYARPSRRPDQCAQVAGRLYQWTLHKFYVDELYLWITHRVIFQRISAPFNWLDRHGVDGFMDLVAQATRLAGAWLRLAVTGWLPTYLGWAATGCAVLTGVLWHWGSAMNWTLALVGMGLVAGLLVWQGSLNLLNKSEPLKRIDQD